MTHYICTGGCHGESNTSGTCQAANCPKHGAPLDACDCADGKHFGDMDHHRSVSSRITSMLLWAVVGLSVASVAMIIWTRTISVAPDAGTNFIPETTLTGSPDEGFNDTPDVEIVTVPIPE
jgi:hypothetical protein